MLKVSFFSYKGGAGRTSLLFNTLPFLAQKLNATENEPIIVLDLDLDSKGLSYLLPNKESGINSIQVLRGDRAVSLRHASNIKNHPFFSQLSPIGEDVGLPEKDDRSILFVSAHAKEGAEFLGEYDNYDSERSSLRTLSKLCQDYSCKAIVMDTPAGSQLSGITALKESNKIVSVMRITNQFRLGTYEFFKQKGQDIQNKEIVIVPNAVPDFSGSGLDMNLTLNDIVVKTKSALANSTNRVNCSLLTNNNKGINEVNLFKFREESLTRTSKIRDLYEDELEAIRMYELLAEELADETN